MSYRKFFSGHFDSSLLIPLCVLLMTAVGAPAYATGGLYSSATTLTEPTPVANDYYGSNSNNGTMLSADGQTAVVAASDASVGSVAGAGKVYIYHNDNGTWTLAKEIDDPDGITNDNFGGAIAVNGDGTVVLIGSQAAVNGQAYAGKAYLFTLVNGTWAQTKEFDDPAATSSDYFGRDCVTLSADGQSLAIGAAGTTVNSQTNAGEAYIYSESNGTWAQVAAFPDPDATGNDFFAQMLAMSGDGQSVLVGSSAAVNGQQYAGKAYLFTFTNGQWMQSHEFDDPLATASDVFSYGGIALSYNGQTAAIAAAGTTVNGNFGAGAGYIFTESNGVWTQAAGITDPDNTAMDNFSTPLSVSSDGNAILFGSVATVSGQSYAGKAYLYTLSNGAWVQSKEFDDPAVSANDEFGTSGVALSGDGETALISAFGTTVNSQTNAGAAYIYQSPDDISLALAANPGSVNTGKSVALDATVTNNDTEVTAYNVVLTDTLPSGLSYASSNAAGGTCSASGTTVTCALASLAPGATWQPTITGSAGSAGTLSVAAAVTSNEPDPNTTNNNATVSVTVSTPPPPTPPPSTSGGGGGALGLLSLFVLCLPILRKHRRS